MKRKTIAQQLAERFGGEWKAIRDGFGWHYEGPEGREVWRYASPILGYDGYSDTEFAIIYIDNKGEQIHDLEGIKTLMKDKGTRYEYE